MARVPEAPTFQEPAPQQEFPSGSEVRGMTELGGVAWGSGKPLRREALLGFARDMLYPGWSTYREADFKTEESRPFFRVFYKSDDVLHLAQAARPPFVNDNDVEFVRIPAHPPFRQ